MEKIGLCVCYDTKNFGSQLQVLATITKIEKLGYNYEIIRYKKKYNIKTILKFIPRIFDPIQMNNIKRKIKKKIMLKKYKFISQKCDKRNEKFNTFVLKKFKNFSQILYGYDSLVRYSKVFDILIVGSDQLWLPSGIDSKFYTLEFASSNQKKISYATSFGVSNIPKNKIQKYKNFLNKLDYISTREIKGKEIIKEITGKKCKVVVDPTLLFSCKEWYEMIPNKNLLNEKYILCYFLGTNIEHRKISNKIKNKTGYKIVTLPFLDNFVKYDVNFGDIKLIDVDAEDFVNLIRHAEYILTDSFHGTVFSIINNKKFITFNRFVESNTSRNSRIDSLLNQLSLTKRKYIKDNEDVLFEEIDYKNVNIKINELKEDSTLFLKSSIESTFK